jgi:hypothetical protein
MTPAVSEEMVERAHKALMSELFLICQPDRGDVFSFMDDHPEVLRAALSTLAPSAAASDLDEAHEQIRDLTKVITELGGIVYAPGEPLTTWKARAEKAEAALAARDEWRACATEFKELCSEWEARVTALEKALAGIEWKSADRDNMEFTARITCYQMDALLSAKGGET